MPVEMYEVVFSFDQPATMRSPLLSTLRQLLSRSVAENSRAAPLLSSQRILIVDSNGERAQYIAALLLSDGYTPFIVPNPLEAYTFFLQGSFLPCVVILGEESSAKNQFFLTRLAQQFVQQYDWKLPFVRLRMRQNNEPQGRSTDSLSHRNPSSSTPLSLSGEQRPGGPASSPLRRSGARGPSADLSGSVRRPAPRSQSLHGLPAQSGEQRVQSDALSFQSPQEKSSPAEQPRSPEPYQSQVSFSGSAGRKGPASDVFEHSLVAGSSFQPGMTPTPPIAKISLIDLSIGRYQLKSVLGGSPLGDAYLTYDRLREQDIVLKTIQTNRVPFHLIEAQERSYNLFQPELDLLQKMKSLYFVPIMNVGESYISGHPFIYKTMPYYGAGSFSSWVSSYTTKVFSLPDVAYAIAQLAAPVQVLHDYGRLYQNFKMTNILLTHEASHMRELQFALGDLAFVRDMINLPKSPEAYRYFSPEQWDGEAFTSSDQYGLAILAYELLTGRPPFQGNSSSVMRRMHLTMAVPPPSTFNSQLNALADKALLRALSKQPEERFESVSAFAFALEQASH